MGMSMLFPKHARFLTKIIGCDVSQRCHWDGSWYATLPQSSFSLLNLSGNFMNLATTLGIYATINKEINQELAFPGGEAFYTKFDTFTSSKLHARKR